MRFHPPSFATEVWATIYDADSMELSVMARDYFEQAWVVPKETILEHRSATQ